MYKGSHNTGFWRMPSSQTAGGVILAIRIQVILVFTHVNHATYSHPTISQHSSDVTLPALCFRNILRSNENLHILFTSSKYYYWFMSFLIIFERFIIIIRDENDFDMALWTIIHNMLLIKIHLDMIIT